MGHYRCRVTAPGHQAYLGRLRIKPGAVTGKQVLLPNALVSVE